MSMKSGEENEAAQRPTSLLWFWVFREREQELSSRAAMGKWETCFWFSTFPWPRSWAVGMWESRALLRDSQGAVGRVGKLVLLFHSFHGPGISTAPGSVIGIAAAAETAFCIAAVAVIWRRSSGVRTRCRSSPVPLVLTPPCSFPA